MKPTIQEIQFSKINPAPYNPRQRLTPADHEYQTIKNSIHEFSLVELPVWNKRTGNLVAGHTRLDILKADGEKSAPCVIVDLPADREKALNITLNNPHVAGKWDDVGLAALLREIEQGMPDLYDGLDMAPLNQEIDLAGGADDEELELEEGIGPPEMELLPFESYNYFVLFFKDAREFEAAAEHFGLAETKVPGYVGKKTIGLGRVIDGAGYLRRLRAANSAARAAKKAQP
jgi:hypothetical protein